MAKRRLIEGLRSILQRQEEADSNDDDSECLGLRQELLHLCNETDSKTYSFSLLYYCYYIELGLFCPCMLAQHVSAARV